MGTRNLIVITFIILTTYLKASCQDSVDFIEIDSIIVENTYDIIFEEFEKHRLFSMDDMDTIFFEYHLDIKLDSLDSELIFNDEAFKRNMRLKLRYVCQETDDTLPIYEGGSHIYKDSTIIATISRFGGIVIFPVFIKSPYLFEYLRIRYLVLKDKFVFLPFSKGYCFQFNWHMAINKNGEIRWFHIERPLEDYSTSEFREKYLDEFIF